MGVKRWGGGLVASALGLACSGSPESLELPPEAASYPVAVRIDTSGEGTFAYVDETDSLNLRAPPAEESDVAFLFYDASLEALDLVPSRVYPNEGRFKSPDASAVLEGAGTEGASWRSFPSRSLPAWIEPFRLPGLCRPHRVKPINLPPRDQSFRPHEVVGLAVIDEENVLISTAEARFFRATWSDAGSPRVTELEVNGERDVHFGGFRSPGRIWFGGDGGRLASTSVQGLESATAVTLELADTFTSGEPASQRAIIDLDGDPEREDDIFALTLNGSVLHFDGARLSSVGQITGTSTTRGSLLDTREIRWSEPEKAVAVTWVRRGEYPIHTFEVGGTPRPLVLPGERERVPSAVALGPAGLFVATTRLTSDRRWESQIWLLPPRAIEWIAYSEATLGIFGLVMERYDGLVAGVGEPFAGMLASQAEGTGAECPPTIASSPLRSVVRTGEHAAVAVGFSFSMDANQLLWIR